MATLTRNVLIGIVSLNTVLILTGLAIVPGTLGSASGVGVVVADIAMQVALASVALLGPVRLARLDRVGWSLGVGVAFAVVYDGHLLLDLAGRPVPLSPYVFFLAAASVASTAVSYRTRRLAQGVFAAVWSLLLGTALWSAGFMVIVYTFWGTQREHLFWLRDGAVADFRRSGGNNLAVFLLQDMQGAVFFHPLLSLAIGLLVGTIAGTAGSAASRLSSRT